MILALVFLLAQSFPPNVLSQPGKTSTQVVNVQGNASGAPIPVTGSLSVSGAADTVGSNATYNANSVCATVSLAGQPSVGFFLGSGTLAGTLTPSVSEDATPSGVSCSGGNYTASKFVDVNGNTSATLVLTNPNAFQHWGIATLAGNRCAKVCTTAFTSGSATGNLVGTVATSPQPAPSADVTDRAGRLLGKVYGSDSNQLATANTGRLQVDVITGGGSNASVVTDGAAPAGSDTQVGASVTTAAPSYTTGQVKPFSLQTDGSLRVAVTAGGGSNASVSTTGAAVPGSATYGGMNVSGNLTGLTGTVNGLKVDGSAVTQPVSGTVTTTPPSNASTNVAQVAGTTTDTNSGAKSAGTLRVVLATDQPQLTNKLLVTPDSVALPANQSVNVSQINAVTPLMGNGTTGTGSQRVTIASDNTAFSVNASQAGAPWAENLQQINGTTILTGNGATGAGSVRVTIANDQTAFGVNLAQYTPNTGRLPVLADQNGAPWSMNLTQFGSSAVVTGTGASGAGIPRMTVSNDSTVGLVAGSAIVGKVGIDQATPGTTNGVQVVAALPTGTNNIGSGPIADGQYGAILGYVKGGSTAPKVSDPATVVSISPNTPINIVNINAGTPLGAKVTGLTNAPVIQVQHVDERGHIAGVKGQLQPPTVNDQAQVTTQSPIPAPVCTQNVNISQTASTKLVSGLGGKRIYICSILVVSTTAQSVSLTEGTGTTCGTGALALAGHTTVANGMALAVNGGWTQTAASPFMLSQVNGDDLCLLQSGAGNVAGSISYVQF